MTMSPFFGKRGVDTGSFCHGRRPTPFGKRLQDTSSVSASELPKSSSATDFDSIARLRLLAVFHDVSSLHCDQISSDGEPVCRMADNATRLLIGWHAVVSIDAVRGVYVLAVNDRSGETVIETASEDILLDHIIAHIARDRGRYLSLTTHGLVTRLVGHTLRDVELSLILETMRQHHFNRARSAEVLGISASTIRDRLKLHRSEVAESEPGGDVFHLRGSPSGD